MIWLTILMNRIDPMLFAEALTAWVRATWPKRPNFVAIDGRPRAARMLAQQAITKDETLDHLTYSSKIRDMLEEHVRATGLTTTVRLRDITDPNFKVD